MKKLILQIVGIVLIALCLSVATGVHPMIIIGLSMIVSFGMKTKGLAFNSCGVIDEDLLINCDTPLQGGVNDRLILINWDDLASVTKNAAGIVTAITLNSGAQAYLVEGKNNSVAPTQALLKLRFSEVFDHIVNFKTFDLDNALKVQLQNAVKGRFIAIVENNFKGTDGDAAFEIYGLDAGLVVTALTRDPNSSETQGAYDITMGSSEFAKEPKLPTTVFLTSYAVTKALVDDLL